MKSKVYTLHSGKKIAFSTFHRPREGDVVFFTREEWVYIREQNFSSAHKDWLWEQKYMNFRYAIIPEKGFTEPSNVVKHCREILDIFKKKSG